MQAAERLGLPRGSGGRRAARLRRKRQPAKQLAQTGGIQFHFKETHVNAPAPTNEGIRRLIFESAKELGLTTKLMPSGAGHDAQAMARLGPVGMIFVPSVGGISHSPQEFSRAEDIRNGAHVLLRTLLKLDGLDRI